MESDNPQKDKDPPPTPKTAAPTDAVRRGFITGFLSWIWQTFVHESAGEEMSDFERSSIGLRLGRLLLAALILVGVAFISGVAGGWGTSSFFRNQEADKYRDKAETVLDANAALIRENNNLKGERDKFEIKLAISEKQAGITSQIGTKPDERLDLLFDHIQAITNELWQLGPSALNFEVLVNGNRTAHGLTRPHIIEVTDRTITIHAKNNGKAIAENLTIRFSPLVGATNVIAPEWIERGSGEVDGKRFPLFEFRAQSSLLPEVTFIAPTITISTNVTHPVVPFDVWVSSDRSKVYKTQVLFVLPR